MCIEARFNLIFETTFVFSHSGNRAVPRDHRGLGQIHHSGGPRVQTLKYTIEEIDRVTVGADRRPRVQMSQIKNQALLLDLR